MLVFQYGSNTSAERLNSEKRLRGDAIDRGLVRTQLPFELYFDVWSSSNNCAAANIRQEGGKSVYGVLYDIPDYLISRDTSGSRKSLDAIEGSLYERRDIAVVNEDGATIDDVVTYIVKEPQPGLTTDLE